MRDERSTIAVGVVERTVTRFWSIGGEVRDGSGCRVVRHASAPDDPLGNFTCAVRDERCLTDLLAPDTRDDAARSRVLIDRDTPAAVEARLALDGWEAHHQLQLVLPADVAVRPPGAVQVAPAPDDAAWDAIHGLFRIDHLEEDRRHGVDPRPPSATRAAVALRRSMAPEVRYLLAEADDPARPSNADAGPLGSIAVWVSDDGIGLIEDVFVHPDARGAGLGTNLLRFAVHEARANGAREILIGAEVDDTPKQLYVRFGFRPAAVLRSYLRPTGDG